MKIVNCLLIGCLMLVMSLSMDISYQNPSVNITSVAFEQPFGIKVMTSQGNISLQLNNTPLNISGLIRFNTSIIQRGSTYKMLWNVNFSRITVPPSFQRNVTLNIQSTFPIPQLNRTREMIDLNYTERCQFDWDYNLTLCQNYSFPFRINRTFYSDTLSSQDFGLSFDDLRESGFPMNVTRINSTAYTIILGVNASNINNLSMLVFDPITWSNGWITIDTVANLTLINSSINNPSQFWCRTSTQCYSNSKLNVTNTGWLNITSGTFLIMNSSVDGGTWIDNFGNLTVFKAQINESNSLYRWTILSEYGSMIDLRNSTFNNFGYDWQNYNALGIVSLTTKTIMVNNTFTKTAGIIFDNDFIVFANNTMVGNTVLDSLSGSQEFNGLWLGFNSGSSNTNATGNLISTFKSCGSDCTDYGIANNGYYNNIIGNTITNIGGTDDGLRPEHSNPLALLGNNNLVENNTIDSCDAGVGLEYALYVDFAYNNVFRNNRINNSLGNCGGIYLDYGTGNYFQNNTIQTVKREPVYVISTNAQNNVFNLTIINNMENLQSCFRIDTAQTQVYNLTSTCGHNSSSLQIDSYPFVSSGNFITNSVLQNNTAVVSGHQGIYLNGNVFNNTITKSLIFGRTWGVRVLNNATQNVISDSIIRKGTGLAPIEVFFSTGNSNNYLVLLNTTLFQNSTSFGTGSKQAYLDYQWHIKAFVNDSSGANLTGANLTADNVTGDFWYTGFTQAGFLYFNLTEKIQNKTMVQYESNYTVNVSMASTIIDLNQTNWSTAQQIVNITTNKDLYFQLTVSSAKYIDVQRMSIYVYLLFLGAILYICGLYAVKINYFVSGLIFLIVSMYAMIFSIMNFDLISNNYNFLLFIFGLMAFGAGVVIMVRKRWR